MCIASCEQREQRSVVAIHRYGKPQTSERKQTADSQQSAILYTQSGKPGPLNVNQGGGWPKETAFRIGD